MPICRSCGVTGQPSDWGRYARNGRLKVLCPGCDQRKEAARKRTEAAQAAGYPGWANTPLYKRLQREAAAAKQGRDYGPYVPQSVRNYRGKMRQVERIADRIRARWAAEWLRPFRSSKHLYRSDSAFREQEKANSRTYYSRHRPQESARVQDYKLANQERVQRWHSTRRERINDGSDGTVTARVIAHLKRVARLCAYCGVRLIRKQTDHMIPLALGGEHSLRNIVIVCPDCNARKAGLSYAEWVDRVEPQHRQRVLALYHERYARWSGGPSGSLQAPRGRGWKWRTLWVAPAHDFWLTS